ncbi:P-loop containing nucleoside triphosphate hydrolase protein [Haematococcus lacustris]
MKPLAPALVTLLICVSAYNPGTQTEGFAYNLLLQYIPFHAESELLSPENVTQTYYDECWLRGIIACEDDVQDLVMQYSRQLLLGTDQTTSLVQRLLEKHHDMDHVLPVQPVLHVLPCADVDEFAAVATVMPSMEQQQALRHIIHKQNGICVVSGGPGTGKTFLTKHLLHHYRTAAVPHIATATTGAAATRLSRHASTIHSALCIFGAGRYLVPLAPSNPQYEAMRSAKVLIIDEMSMLSCQMLSLVLYRLQQCCGCRSFADVLQEKLIILVGDHAQLPPVCHCKTDQDEFCRACHISSHPLWMAADKLTLKHSVRHADDPAFVDFLNIIRGRPPTQAEIDDIFGDAIITEREVCNATANRLSKLYLLLHHTAATTGPGC